MSLYFVELLLPWVGTDLIETGVGRGGGVVSGWGGLKMVRDWKIPRVHQVSQE